VLHASAPANTAFGALQHENVACTWSLRLDEVVAAIHGDHAEDTTIEVERTSGVPDAKRQVRQTEGGD
jgi:hypothetical protein